MKKVLVTIVFIILVVGMIGLAVGVGSTLNQPAAQQEAGTQQALTGSNSVATTTASTTTTTATASSANTTNQSSQTMDGLKITDTKVGTGAAVVTGDTVNVLYTGSLDDGTVFDASSKHGNVPFTFTVPGQVIQGWNLGIIGMKVGGTRELVIPSALGYGAQGYPGVIPPNATLHFTIQLLSIGTSSAQ